MPKSLFQMSATEHCDAALTLLIEAKSVIRDPRQLADVERIIDSVLRARKHIARQEN